MLIGNNAYFDGNTHVEFVSYTGEYPCLCSGTLRLLIDDEEVIFGHDACCDSLPESYPKFWSSGGEAYFETGWDPVVTSGEWEIDDYKLPDQYRQYAAEIDEVFNANVPYGCCGGCL